MPGRVGSIHHLELWVGDLATAEASWGWLLTALGYRCSDRWPRGQSWRLEDTRPSEPGTYVVLESGPDVAAVPHDRLRPGLNHVAFFAGSRDQVEALAQQAPEHGWTLLFADRHPFAGGPDTYAAYLEDPAGFEVELVADEPPAQQPAPGDEP